MIAMATLHVRNVPPDVYEGLRARAERAGRSINAETIAILREALGSAPGDDILARLERLAFELPEGAPTPEEIIREARDGSR